MDVILGMIDMGVGLAQAPVIVEVVNSNISPLRNSTDAEGPNRRVPSAPQTQPAS